MAGGIDVKDLRFGFWLAAGMALFGLIMAAFHWAASKARG
jgi:hypothetical protein